MPNNILHKRSSVPGAVPSLAQLSYGELAVNTADGKLFAKKENGTVVDLTQPTVVDGGVVPRFSFTLTPIERTFAPSSTNSRVDRDRNLVEAVGPTLIYDYGILVRQHLPNVFVPVTLSTSNAATTITDNLLSSPSGAATTVLRASATDGSDEFYEESVTLSLLTGTASQSFSSWVTGSSAENATTAVDSRIAVAGKVKPIFTVQDHVAASYTRNTNCWAADLDLTCVSPWNSTGANTRAGTLISPRHVLFAAHYQISPGATIRFVQSDNTVVTRTVTAVRQHPEYIGATDGYKRDIAVGVLDSDVPAGISFARILPDDWASKLPSISPAARIPALCLDQEENALVSELGNIGTDLTSFYTPNSGSQRAAFFENIIVGDSGNPAFLILSGQLVLLSVWTFGGAGSGASITLQKTAINDMMTQLGGGYQLTQISLSSFPSY
jgi:hypothetical protein